MQEIIKVQIIMDLMQSLKTDVNKGSNKCCKKFMNLSQVMGISPGQ